MTRSVKTRWPSRAASPSWPPYSSARVAWTRPSRTPAGPSRSSRRSFDRIIPRPRPSLKNLANTLDPLDRWPEAEPLFRESLAHARRVTPGSLDEMRALLDYGRVLAANDRWEDARPLLEEAYEMAQGLRIPPVAQAAATALAQGHRAAGEDAAAAR